METEYLDYWYTMAALGALRTIDEVVDGMKRLPAEVGGVLHGRFRMNGTVWRALDKVTDLATRAGVAIYSVDPGGVRARARELQKDVPVIEPDTIGPRPPLFPGEDEPFPLGDMADLASRTGGLYYRNRNDIRSVFAKRRTIIRLLPAGLLAARGHVRRGGAREVSSRYGSRAETRITGAVEELKRRYWRVSKSTWPQYSMSEKLFRNRQTVYFR